MRLNHTLARFSVHRRAISDVHGGGFRVVSGAEDPCGVNTVGGYNKIRRYDQIGRRKTPFLTPLIPAFHDASQFVRTPEQGVCLCDVAFTDGRADPRGRDRPGRMLIAVGNEVDPDDIKTAIAAHRVQQGHIPLAILAEMKILADNDRATIQAVAQNTLHKCFGALLAVFKIELQHRHPIQPGVASRGVKSFGAESGRTTVAG